MHILLEESKNFSLVKIIAANWAEKFFSSMKLRIDYMRLDVCEKRMAIVEMKKIRL
jgi:hypothetical protein